MSYLQYVPVDAHRVHKEHLDDVLIANFRGDLPTHLPADILDSACLCESERALLARHYVRDQELDEQTEALDARIWRRSIPVILPAEVSDMGEFLFVRDYYKKNQKNIVLNKKYLREEQEVALMNRFVDPEYQISVRDRHQISNITDRLDCDSRPSRYYMSMINDLRNYFFYRKHHEHVPGIMLVEVARQAIYAQYYRTSQHKRGEITLTIRKLDCEFEDFVDANYPVSVSVDTTTDEAEMQAVGTERRAATFWQNGRQVATVSIAGKAIGLRLFKRLRLVRPAANHWFIPVKAFAPSALFFDSGDARSEGKLNKVSRTAMVVRFERRPEIAASMRFVLNVDTIGYIDGSVRVDSVQQERDAWVCQLGIAELSTDAERKWLEAIKNFSHLDVCAGAH